MLAEPPVVFQPVLDRLQAGCREYFDAGTASIVPLEHSRREFSELLRIQVALPERALEAFVKVLRPVSDDAPARAVAARRVAASFESALALRRASAGAECVTTVRPIACFPEHFAIVTERADGVTLLERVTTELRRVRGGSIASLEIAMRGVGAWLMAFQASASNGGSFRLADAREYLDVRLRRLVARRSAEFTSEFRAALLEGFDGTASAVEDTDLVAVPVHGDFALGNLLIDDGRVTVLDFDMMAPGSRYHDLAHLHLQLDLAKAKPWLRGGDLARLQRALLQGFDERLREERPLFRLMLLQHIVCHLERLLAAREAFLPALYTRRQVRRHYRWLRTFAAQGGH